MDANSIFQLMVAASLERGKTLRVTDQISCDELLGMAGAGLVEIHINGDQAHPSITLKRLTARGRQVLRAFATPAPFKQLDTSVGKIKPRKIGSGNAIPFRRDRAGRPLGLGNFRYRP